MSKEQLQTNNTELNQNNTELVDVLEKLNEGLVDLSGDTVTAEKMIDGITAHQANGIAVIGTIPNNGDVNSAIQSGMLKTGYTSGGAIANLIAENIKKGVTIAGVTGSLTPEKLFDSGTVKGSGKTYWTIPHNLGRAPKVLALWIATATGSAYTIDKVMYVTDGTRSMHIQISGSGSGNSAGMTYTPSANSVYITKDERFSSSVKFDSGNYYYFVA